MRMLVLALMLVAGAILMLLINMAFLQRDTHTRLRIENLDAQIDIYPAHFATAEWPEDARNELATLSQESARMRKFPALGKTIQPCILLILHMTGTVVFVGALSALQNGVQHLQAKTELA